MILTPLDFFGHESSPIGQTPSFTVPGHSFLLLLSPQSLSAKRHLPLSQPGQDTSMISQSAKSVTWLQSKY